MRIRFLIMVLAVGSAMVWAQDSSSQNSSTQDSSGKAAPDAASSGKEAGKASSGAGSSGNAAPDSSARGAASGGAGEESSSHDTRVDLSPPKDDEKEHPNSKAAVADLEPRDVPDNGGVEEFHPWNPMKAIKDIEVGDFYFKRKSYKAALDRYKEALYYKDGDAVANFRVAECQEKLGNKAEARNSYEQYLKILPEGPLAKEAHAALGRLPKAQ